MPQSNPHRTLRLFIVRMLTFVLVGIATFAIVYIILGSKPRWSITLQEKSDGFDLMPTFDQVRQQLTLFTRRNRWPDSCLLIDMATGNIINEASCYYDVDILRYYRDAVFSVNEDVIYKFYGVRDDAEPDRISRNINVGSKSKETPIREIGQVNNVKNEEVKLHWGPPDSRRLLVKRAIMQQAAWLFFQPSTCLSSCLAAFLCEDLPICLCDIYQIKPDGMSLVKRLILPVGMVSGVTLSKDSKELIVPGVVCDGQYGIGFIDFETMKYKRCIALDKVLMDTHFAFKSDDTFMYYITKQPREFVLARTADGKVLHRSESSFKYQVHSRLPYLLLTGWQNRPNGVVCTLLDMSLAKSHELKFPGYDAAWFGENTIVVQDVQQSPQSKWGEVADWLSDKFSIASLRQRGITSSSIYNMTTGELIHRDRGVIRPVGSPGNMEGCLIFSNEVREDHFKTVAYFDSYRQPVMAWAILASILLPMLLLLMQFLFSSKRRHLPS